MTHDEMIAVIRAHKDGRQIQWNAGRTDSWYDCETPCWGFANCSYRIKPGAPQPREFRIAVDENGYVICGREISLMSTDTGGVHVREILKEEG